MASPSFVFDVRPGVDVRRAIVLFGCPTAGYVGAIVAEHLARSLDMPLVGGVRSNAFPSVFPVKDGRLRPAVRIHALDTATDAGVDADRLVVVTADFAPAAHYARPFADALLQWTREVDAQLLLLPDAIPLAGGGVPDLYGVAATKRAAKAMRDMAVDPLEEGAVAGFTGILLDAASRAGVDALCLLGETDPAFPDARSAARIVGALRPLLPDAKLESESLLEEAEMVESQVRDAFERAMDEVRRQDEPSTPMFR